MNPLKLLKVYTKATRLWSLVEEGTQSYTRHNNMMSKSLFVSKTFWFNVLTATVEFSGVLPIPPGVAAIIASVGNIALRFVTDRPVRLG